MMTWHEDRQISPGVPDLHYVTLGQQGDSGRFRVGWLEVKALEKDISPKNKIGVEPSQHQYLRRWHPYMPIHFIVRVVDRVFVVPGKYHKEINGATCYADLAALSDHQFHQSLIAEELPPFLREVTRI